MSRSVKLLLVAARIALHNLRANKMRSFLTIIGVVIGVASVILMVAVGEGARDRVMQEFQAMGTDLLLVFPGRVKGHHRVRVTRTTVLEVEDAEALRDRCPSVRAVAPEVANFTQVKYFDENIAANIVGTTPAYRTIRVLDVREGRFFTGEEADRGARVCVLGGEIAQKLFRGGPAVGEAVRIRGTPFEVVGVLELKGRAGFNSLDEQVIVPLEAYFRRLSAKRFLRMINVQAVSPARAADAKREIEELMNLRHPPNAAGESQIGVFDFTEVLGRAQTAVGAFAFLIAASAALSLLVGGIGIMNIMLVSVTERTREIGVRKALGATRRDILVQFLGEAVVVSVLGGVLGILAGWLGISALRTLGDFNAQLPAWAVAAAVATSGLTGVVFGVYPAWRAAGLDPIAALRWQ